jgi:hypothetical protein
LRDLYRIAIPVKSIAQAIAYAIGQPADVEIDELVIRPTAQEFSSDLSQVIGQEPRGSHTRAAPLATRTALFQSIVRQQRAIAAEQVRA